MEEIRPRAAVLRDALQGSKPVTPVDTGLLTVAEACQYLRVSKWTLYRLIQASKLKTVKIGSRRLVRRQSMADFVDRLEAEVGS